MWFNKKISILLALVFNTIVYKVTGLPSFPRGPGGPGIEWAVVCESPWQTDKNIHMAHFT